MKQVEHILTNKQGKKHQDQYQLSLSSFSAMSDMGINYYKLLVTPTNESAKIAHKTHRRALVQYRLVKTDQLNSNRSFCGTWWPFHQ